MSNKVFGATEFLQAWGLWQSKGHDPASKLQSFTVEGGRINVGLLDYLDLDTVVFPAHAHADYAAAFQAVASALAKADKGESNE